jgi:hypothetical protein
MPCGSSLRFVRFLAPALALLVAEGARAETLTGVCPDGSIFIVRRAQDIPCRGAKMVEPEAVPPLNPQFLPRPYAWDVFQRETNPNNPYNLVGAGSAPGTPPAPPQVAAPPPTQAPAPVPSVAPAPSAPPTPVSVASVAPSGALDLALAPDEIQQLGAIVEAWQQHVPATLVKPGTQDPRGMLLRVARSNALEGRVLEALARRGAPAGPVLAFQGVAVEAGDFFPNLTFVQGHVAFHPDPADPLQYGLLSGRSGPLPAGATVLGYVVLPAHVDLAKPLDVYWDDRRITATLTPQ